ncbi:MAG: ISKra4 family transposase, partial [Cyanobacteria bacterium J06639_1]
PHGWQAQRLHLAKHTRWSPLLNRCCLLLSANESYQRASEDIQVLTGIAVSRGTHQRLVHRHEFESSPNSASTTVTELSLDGGKVRLRTPEGEPCEWRDYKAVNLHQHQIAAYFRDPEALIAWVHDHPLASSSLVCVGDGHDGIWNLVARIGKREQRLEVLDWFHLMENLAKVRGSARRLRAVEARLWHGDVDGAMVLFEDWHHRRVERFRGSIQFQ